MTPKQRVLKKYPNAGVIKFGSYTLIHLPLGSDVTEAKAWANAAKRLRRVSTRKADEQR